MTSLFKGVGYCLLTLTYIVVVAASVVTLYPYGVKVVNYVNDAVKHHQQQQQPQHRHPFPRRANPCPVQPKCPCGPECECPGGCPENCPVPPPNVKPAAP